MDGFYYATPSHPALINAGYIVFLIFTLWPFYLGFEDVLKRLEKWEGMVGGVARRLRALWYKYKLDRPLEMPRWHFWLLVFLIFVVLKECLLRLPSMFGLLFVVGCYTPLGLDWLLDILEKKKK